MSTRTQAISAIIRKDVQLLWPLALTLIVLQFITTAFFHEVTELIGAHLPTDRAVLGTHDVLYWLGAFVPPVLAAIFIFLAVQNDVATGTHHDWLTRPVGALEIAIAKIVLVLGVVLAPYILGNVVFMLMRHVDPSLLWPPMILVLRNCLTGILLAWLVSSLLQAVLAMVGLVILSALTTAFMMAGLAAFYFAMRAHAGLAPGPSPETGRDAPSPERLLIQLVIQGGVMWPVLWLLLVQRRVARARLVFAVAYVLATAIPMVQTKMVAPARATQATYAIAQIPIREIPHA